MELKILKIKNNGVILNVLQGCNLGNFLLYDETFDDGIPSNVWPHMYRFGNKYVEEGDFIFLHFNKGRNHREQTEEGYSVFHFYWGFDSDVNILNNDGDTLHLIKIDEENRKRVF